jgi:hypothetical protein
VAAILFDDVVVTVGLLFAVTFVSTVESLTSQVVTRLCEISTFGEKMPKTKF